MSQPNGPGSDQARADYLHRFDKRLSWFSRAATFRNVGIQTSWSLALLAGAAVPLAAAVISQGTFTWVTPSLGFLVVVATGAERLFARTLDAGRALDDLRRRLSRERRLYHTGTGPYAEDGDRFARFIERTERDIAKYDQETVRAHADEARSS